MSNKGHQGIELAMRVFLLGYDAAAAGLSRERALIELLREYDEVKKATK